MGLEGSPTIEARVSADRLALIASGAWLARNAATLERRIIALEREPLAAHSVTVDLSDISQLDTFGAWLVERLCRSYVSRGVTPDVVGLAEDYRGLAADIARAPGDVERPRAKPKITLMLELVGRAVAEIGTTAMDILNMSGALVTALGRTLRHPRSFRLTSMVHQLEQVGWRALPIVFLITLLIGSIIAQQGFFHFRKFGADIFVVDMVGILVLREIGVLLVSIMVAGRSGSAYTAELGSMKMREEIDALRTMGFDPIEVLILPRILALIIALPILTFLGSMAALYGGGLVSWLYGGLQPETFLSRLREAISIDHFKVGLIKAPFMALVIGVVSCVEGLNVRGSAESLGQHTTASVVKSIFFVIVLDGFFAIFFASIGM